jgi:SAM-dependent methyltransferase
VKIREAVEALGRKGTQADQLYYMLERTKLQVADPYCDALTSRVMPLIDLIRPRLSGTFLDVGCYGGWVYPKVRDLVEYHGIDNWPVAIDAAKQLFGDHFELADVREYDKKHDIVFASQLGPETPEDDQIIEKLKSLANRMLVVTGLYVTPSAGAEVIPGMAHPTVIWTF